MPRSVQFLADEFDSRTQESLEFVERLELNKGSYRDGPGALTTHYVEFGYELSYLQIFGFWEDFLERAFVRLMCGYTRGGIREPSIAGSSYSRDIAAATIAMLGGRDYVAWYVPSVIVSRCRKFFVASNFENVIASATDILERHRRIRHQIAHVQEHARLEFDGVARKLTGRRYPASRVGKFLRDDRLSPVPGQVWLVTLTQQLRNLAGQLGR